MNKVNLLGVEYDCISRYNTLPSFQKVLLSRMVNFKSQYFSDIRVNRNLSEVKNDQSDAAEKNLRKKSTFKITYDYFIEFCSNTSIHGFKFLTEKKRWTAERLWWLIILGICFYLCGSLMLITLNKRERSPVFISFSKEPLQIGDVPFPAVTICPENKVKKTKYNYLDFLSRALNNNLTEEEQKKFHDISMICTLGMSSISSGFPQSDHDTTFVNIIESAPELEDILKRAVLDFAYVKFSPIFTDEGLCYSFNMLDRNELFSSVTYLPEGHGIHQNIFYWSIDNNYEKTKKLTVPFRTFHIKNGLALTFVDSSINENKRCDFRTGFKIILHHPAEIPNTRNFIAVSNKGLHDIQINVEATLTATELKDYDPLKRRCYFSHERQLKFYKIYTEPNCELECIANYTLHRCGCVDYYMPHEASTKICGDSKFVCAFNANKYLIENEYSDTAPSNESKVYCNCLPSCTSIKYKAEFQTLNPFLENDTVVDKVNKFLSVWISFKEQSFMPKIRNELFSSTDIWASCGGLLGLFTGFSIISLAEIVYFCSLRWICNIFSLLKLSGLIRLTEEIAEIVK